MKTLLVLGILLYTANSLALCERYGQFVDLTSETVSKVLNCKNDKEVRVDIDELGHTLGFCNDIESKGFICFAVSKTAVYIVEQQIPTEWECAPDLAMGELDIIITKTCELLTGF